MFSHSIHVRRRLIDVVKRDDEKRHTIVKEYTQLYSGRLRPYNRRQLF